MARTAHRVAHYSYGIYLCHISGILVGRTMLRGHSTFMQTALTLATVAVASVALYHCIEAPMIRLGGKLVKKI